jgi:hypothetical protein
MAVTHFEKLKKITKKLTQLTSEKFALEQKKNETQSVHEARSLSNSILHLNKTISPVRNEKIDWHTNMVLDISHLCDKREDEIARQKDRARRIAHEEKRQKNQAKVPKPRKNSDKRMVVVNEDAMPISSSSCNITFIKWSAWQYHDYKHVL